MQHRSRFLVVAALAALAVVATACSGGASAADGGTPTLTIASPAKGATVTEPFTINMDSSVPLGDPSTGDDHVHFCVDGHSCDTEYMLAYGDTFSMSGLAPGTHTIEASLRHADHSDTGVRTSFTVTVTGTGAATSPSPVTSGGYANGY